jgi:addiction module RelE/StbE family toxin
MRRLAWDASFRRAFKRYARNDVPRQQRIFGVLAKLVNDPFQPTLRTHKLSGELDGLWGCWVEYDCRIVFALDSDPATGDEIVVLVDIGTHDEVY